MRLKTRWFGIGAAHLALSAAPLNLLAQQSVLLRYHPSPNVRLQTLHWSDITMTIAESTGEEGEVDSVTIEGASLQSVTQHVRAVRGTQYDLDVRLDSTRARMRPVGGAWRLLPDSGTPSVQLVLDDRMRVSEVVLTGPDSVPPAALQRLRGLAGGLELILPEDPVAPGESWTSDLVFPFEFTGLEEAGVSRDTEAVDLVARSTVTLDSVVIRAVDTLAYLQVRGSLLTTTFTDAVEVAEGSLTVNGSFAGRLIWSTGWNAYVSGAMRALVTMTMSIAVAEAGSPGATVRWDISNRFQIRP